MTRSHRSYLLVVLAAALALAVSVGAAAARAADSTSPCTFGAGHSSVWDVYCTNAPAFGASGSGGVNLEVVGAFTLRATAVAVGVDPGDGSGVHIRGVQASGTDSRDRTFGTLHRQWIAYGSQLEISGNCVSGCHLRLWAARWNGYVAGYGWADFQGSAGARTTAAESFVTAATHGMTLMFGGAASGHDYPGGGLIGMNSGRGGFVTAQPAGPRTRAARRRVAGLVSSVNALRRRYPLDSAWA